MDCSSGCGVTARRKTNTKPHPCFDGHAQNEVMRVHLPVAPKCNLQCGYCDRLSDCVNESRPGVSSSVLSPEQAVEYVGKVLDTGAPLGVVGIAGPGDAFANPLATMETLQGIASKYPDLQLCVSSNGLAMEEFVEPLADLGLHHATLTINGIDPEITKNVYAWARYKGKTYKGLDAAQLLLERQFASLEAMKEAGLTVKVNTVVLPGINDNHIEELAEALKGFKVDRLNLIPVKPAPRTLLQDIDEPSEADMKILQHSASKHVPANAALQALPS